MYSVTFLTGSVSRKSGGFFVSVRRMAASLADCGVAMNVLSLKDEYTEEDIPTWKPLKPSVFSPTGPSAFGYCPALAHKLHALNPDLTHLHGIWQYPSLVSFRWTKLCGKPHVVSPRGMLDPWALHNSRFKKILAAALFEKSNLRTAACIHALNDSEYHSIRSYGLTNPVCVIPNGVDIPTGCPAPMQPPWQPDFVQSRKVLLFLGRIHPKKGLHHLLRAWKANPAPGWCLVIAGWDDGGHEAALRQAVHKLDIANDVFFTGPLHGDAKEAALRAAGAFVLPSLSEGLPIAVLEAWANRIPVIMTPQCNLPEGFASGAAIKADPDPNSLAEALSTLGSMTEDARAAMGMRGVDLARRRFAWPKIAAEMKTVYEWVLNGGETPACVKMGS